ncbi:hypothetical protein [Halocola ammonii]
MNNSKLFYSILLLAFLGVTSCEKETEFKKSNSYDFSKDQYLNIDPETSKRWVAETAEKFENPNQRNSTETYTLQEALFLSEASLNFLRGEPESLDTRNISRYTESFSLTSFDENGTKMIHETDLFQLMSEVNQFIDNKLTSGFGVNLVDLHINSTGSGEVTLLAAVDTAPINTNWIDAFNEFDPEEKYYSIGIPQAQNPAPNCYNQPYNGGCSSATKRSWKAINSELNEYYFPLLQREEEYHFENVTILYWVSHWDFATLYPNENCVEIPYATWGCLDHLWQNEGVYYYNNLYPHSQPSELFACVTGDRMNTYMEKVQEYLAWRIAENQALGINRNAVAYLNYVGDCTPVAPPGETINTYTMGHKFEYKLGLKVYE